MNTIVRCSCLIAAMVPLLLAMAPQPQPSSVETLLGVIDEGGLLTPMISFDGVQWRHEWPEPDQRLEDVTLPSSLATLPRAWTRFPVAARWYAWPKGGAATRQIQLKAPVRYKAHCVPGIALQSDFPPAPRRTPEHTWPKQKQALAVSNEAVRVEPIEQLRGGGEHAAVTPDGPVEQDLLSAARAPFRLLARKALSQGGHQVEQASVPIRWTKAWRYTLTGSREQVYLLEGRIKHEQWRGALTGFLWLKARDGVLGEHRGYAVMDDEDFKRTVHHAPLGVVRIGSHHFWVSERRGWESESYQFVDLTSSMLTEVLVARGGGC